MHGPTVTFLGKSEAEKRLLVNQKLTQWVKENPGVAVLVGGPGQRSPSQILNKYQVRSPRVWMVQLHML